ncbi:MAG: DnaJ domain-containing protein [Chloroflexi bacterium]|nr:DnaJ domain-containing protein [Chloroflexota bacterium]
MPGKDFYAILGVSKHASEKEIRAAYRRLARQYHPDVNPGDKVAEARFKEINEAYQVLSDPEKRKKYDQFGEHWERADQFTQAGRGGNGFTGTFRHGGGAPGRGQGPFGFGDFDLGDFDSLLGNLFGRAGGRGGFGGAGTRQAQRGQDVEAPVQVSLEEAYQGATRVIQVETEEVCPTCQGSGTTGRTPCATCGGDGTVPRLKRLEVKIPAGVKDGARVRIAGEGGAAVGRAPRGDLYLLVSVQPHQAFERKDDDLHVEVGVPLTTAVLGGEAEVPTLGGKKVMLKVPPETQNGATFRLAGLGMPRLGTSGKGDLYAKIKVVLPTRLTARQKQLFEELRGALAGTSA